MEAPASLMVFTSPEAELPAFLCTFLGSEQEAANEADALQQNP
tara:strand:- start:201 stop:329 length:129 start_codon:yes stop_codon:yes gene_type:complete